MRNVNDRITAAVLGVVGGASLRLPTHLVVGAELGRSAFEDDPAVAHHVKTARDFKCDRQLLLDQEDRHTAASDLGKKGGDLLDPTSPRF